jgi:parallel beta-helix repeat protein
VEKLITISCKISSISDVYRSLKDNDVLSKGIATNDNKSQWLLNAGIVVSQGSTLYINSTDTSWLKINADGDNEHIIQVYGSLKIDSVKITSWNTETNSYATTDEETTNEGTEPRPYIIVEEEATGTTDITNSEIAYLKYLSYYGGHGSVLRNNDIHHIWFGGFYSNGVGNMIIEDNHIHDNTHYGIDPHTGTHDMIIRNNLVHDHGSMGIICSLDCFNIVIEGNEVYNSNGAGIMFSRNMYDSIARDNYVHDEEQCIFVSASHNNEIHNNKAENCKNGIYLKYSSSENSVYNNTIINAEKGLKTNTGASDNRFYTNTIINATELGISNEDDPRDGNIFTDNTLINATSIGQDGEEEEEEEGERTT